jgi:hypothetical protein
MRLQELKDAVGQQPFRPFRVFLTDGATYDVRHPELCMLGHGSAIIGLPAAGEPEPLFDRHVIVDLSHIFRMEPLATTVPGNSQES